MRGTRADRPIGLEKGALRSAFPRLKAAAEIGGVNVKSGLTLLTPGVL